MKRYVVEGLDALDDSIMLVYYVYADTSTEAVQQSQARFVKENPEINDSAVVFLAKELHAI